MKKIALFIANGSEEMEAITQKSVLERGGLKVDIVSVNEKEVTTSHGVRIIADRLIDDIKENEYDAFILPGGVDGTNNFKNSGKLMELLKSAYEENKLVCAICAAPQALGKAGVLKDKNFTCYEGFQKEIKDGNYTGEGVVKDENVITGRGPYYSLQFAIKILETLTSTEKKDEVLNGMLYNK